MGIGVLFALTLPGLVVLLVVVATVEHAWSRFGRRSPVYRRERHALSAGGMDVFSAALFPGKAVDLEQQRVREMTRDDVDDGAPPYRRIDLDSGVAHIDVRRHGERRREAAVPEMQPAGHLRDTRASYRRTGRTDEGEQP